MKKSILLLICFMVLNVNNVNASYILISQNKPVTANNYYTSYVPENLTDGTTATCWLNPSYSGWAQVDLEAPVSISKVIFYDLVSAGSSTISLYIDSNFIETQTLALSGGVITPFEFTFDEVVGQLVKVEISNSSSWVEGHEFEIYQDEQSGVIPEPTTFIMLACALSKWITTKRK